MNSLPGVQRVIAAGTRPPGFDLHVPLLSLPRIFGTTYNTIPADIPYLSASADRLNTWKQRLDALGGRMKVGLVWAGNPQHVDDAQRSMKPSHLADLAGLTDIVFVSLQKRDNPLASEALPAGLEVVDVSQDLNDFADTAAAMMHLDLTLTIDSATAHLAGALARTVWTLLAYAADWRWKDDGDSTPWYPTMRLFRQPSPGDWPAVIRSVRDALLAHAKPQ
jgi:ADP-heptose:LPS heptosyltransferase